MSTKRKLDRLKRIREQCESEGRSPNSGEIREAEMLLDEIEIGESEDFFDRRGRFNGLAEMGIEEFSPRSPSAVRGKHFGSFGEQLSAIKQAASPTGRVDRRLYTVHEERAATGLSESIPSDGGFLIESAFANEILRSAIAGAPLLPRLKKYSISRPSMKIPAEDETSRADGSRHGGVRGYWIAEAGEKQASKPKFRQLELNLHKVVVLVYATDELLEDAAMLDSYVRDVAADEIGFKVQEAVVNGTGAGMPLGIVSSGAKITASKETGQASATVIYQNLLNMWSRMIARSRRTAVWLINQDVEPQLYQMSLAIGTGGSAVFLPGGGLSEVPYATLFGRPVLPIENCQALGTEGDVILFDPQSYILADRGAIQSDVSIHVRFVYDESVFRFVYRVDGMPKLASPITPYSGGDTLSTIVTLEAR